jgi:carbon-monoxide dehydrogenase iron sulfur subunit
MMRIRVDKTRCTGCHLCEVVCSLFHTGKINTERSAIRIQKDDLNTSMNVPALCRQCKEMKCLSDENVEEREERAKFIWDQGRVDRCPFNAIRAFNGQAFHCDLCGGSPQCVKVCTVKAISISRSAQNA